MAMLFSQFVKMLQMQIEARGDLVVRKTRSNLMPPLQHPYNFTTGQIQKLLNMQDELNSYIHPEWKQQNFDWNFAIIDECLEIKEHLGWKWWKEGYKAGLTAQNQKQVQLEAIDILHFLLSIASENDIADSSVSYWLNAKPRNFDLDKVVEDSISCAANCDPEIYIVWANLAHAVGLTEQMVLETYVQKYVLNKFRQDHGYKDGTYCKVWEVGFVPGLNTSRLCKNEDNEVLAYIVKCAKEEGEQITDQEALYAQLEYWHKNRMNK